LLSEGGRLRSVTISDKPANLDQVLADQRDYYDARAPEYDEWWQRQGRYARDEEANARWFAEMDEVHASLRAAELSGEILELAPGTGNWTLALARSAHHLTALDGSPRMIELNRQRLAAAGLADRVTYGQVDLFAWRPERTYDAVFMGFFLSHVPEERLNPFLGSVAEALRPGGMVFIVDSRPDPTSSSPDQPLPPPDEPIMTRRLNDGRAFQIVKIYRSAAEVQDDFARHGIALAVHETAHYFQYGSGRSSPPL
jgi:demethylmenaquinone methyltransferase/2-methoxy-6-polyprenyl-1,4-benzoquinol methylase